MTINNFKERTTFAHLWLNDEMQDLAERGYKNYWDNIVSETNNLLIYQKPTIERKSSCSGIPDSVTQNLTYTCWGKTQGITESWETSKGEARTGVVMATWKIHRCGRVTSVEMKKVTPTNVILTAIRTSYVNSEGYWLLIDLEKCIIISTFTVVNQPFVALAEPPHRYTTQLFEVSAVVLGCLRGNGTDMRLGTACRLGRSKPVTYFSSIDDGKTIS